VASAAAAPRAGAPATWWTRVSTDASDCRPAAGRVPPDAAARMASAAERAPAASNSCWSATA